MTSIARAVAAAGRSTCQLPDTLPLPPVPRRVYSGPVDACSMRTVVQSASSSSATIIGSDVRTPCPISCLPTMIVTTPSGSMRSHAFGRHGFFSSSSERARAAPRSRAVPLTAVMRMKSRRVVAMRSLYGSAARLRCNSIVTAPGLLVPHRQHGAREPRDGAGDPERGVAALIEQRAEVRAEEHADGPHQNPEAHVPAAILLGREAGDVRAGDRSVDHLAEGPDDEGGDERGHRPREAGEREADAGEEISEGDERLRREPLRPRDDGELEEHDDHAVDRDQRAIRRGAVAEALDVERQRGVNLELDPRDAERRREEEQEGAVAQGMAERLRALLELFLRAESVRQRDERDDAVGEGRDRVAGEQQEERAVGEEARRGRTGREAEVDREAIHPERGHALLRRNEIAKERRRRGTVHLARESDEERADDDGR